jgi:hypothetical protein
MKKIIFIILLFSNLLNANELGLPTEATKNHRASILDSFELAPIDIATLNPNIPISSIEDSEKNGYKGRAYPGIGSGMIRVPGKNNEFLCLPIEALILIM